MLRFLTYCIGMLVYDRKSRAKSSSLLRLLDPVNAPGVGEASYQRIFYGPRAEATLEYHVVLR